MTLSVIRRLLIRLGGDTVRERTVTEDPEKCVSDLRPGTTTGGCQYAMNTLRG